MDFTREQEQAIRTRGKDILVSAGAGAGKTRVLVTRICEMILDRENPVRADEFLVLTFTNAAAGEMKERIIKDLQERLALDPENSYLRSQIRTIRHAQISTIHSFCHHLIRTHFNELGIDPAFRIGEEGERELLKQEVMEELLEERYASGSRSFLDLVEAYAPGRDDLTLEGMIEKLYRFSKGFPDPDGWFAGLEEDYAAMGAGPGLEESAVIRVLTDNGKERLCRAGEALEKAIITAESAEVAGKICACLREERELVGDLLNKEGYTAFRTALLAARLPKYPTKTGKLKEWPYFDAVKKAHEKLKKTIEELTGLDFAKSPDRLMEEQEQILPLIREWISLTKRFRELYLAKKKENNLYDFDDLEEFALDLLVDSYDEEGRPLPSQTAREIAGTYKAIFVDEYQDTSLIQETIISLLSDCGKSSLFVVGDVKQSIYRFRQARPDLFLARYHAYERGEGLKIELRDNFRSSPDVLEVCNRVFSRWMREDFGGIDYNDRIKLVAGAESTMAGKHYPQETMLFVQDRETEVHEVDMVLAESAMIADRIRSLHEDEGVNYDKIVILLRSVKSSGRFMADCLESWNIPVVCGSETGYFLTREIRVILNYLSVIDNLYQDIPMASSMLSGIGGFSPRDLATLKIQVDPSMRGEYSLYELMELYRERGEEEELKDRISRFLDRLKSFRRRKQEMLLHELVWDIYRETGFYEEVLAMPHAEKRVRNLMLLLEHAKNYEKNVFKGLFYFIRHMEKLRTYELEPGDRSLDDYSGGAVRIMTIHKSKGLEFPVVFVSMLSKGFSGKDLNDRILLHPRLGIGTEVYDLEERTKSSTVIRTAIRRQLAREALEEELRVLYVAMTRAQERLILTSTVKEKTLEEAETGTGFFTDPDQAGSFLDWILPVAADRDWEDCRKYHFADLAEFLKKTALGRKTTDLSEMVSAPETISSDAGRVRKAFGRVYPFASCVDWKRKYSVSELKKLAMQKLPEEEIPVWESPLSMEEEEPVPAFLKEKEEESSGTVYGTMVHKVMELLPFGRIRNEEELGAELGAIADSCQEISLSFCAGIQDAVSSFLFSEYGEIFRKMDREGMLHKELPFTVGLDSSLIHPGTEEGERIVLQGIVDVCGEDEDGLWLLDYKTDRIRPGQEALLLDRYKTQMLYYRLALEQMTDRKVCRSMIYSFALRKFIEYDI